MATKEEMYKNLLDSMQDLSEVQKTLRAILYGMSGAGKTIFAMMIAQAITPSDQIVLYIDFSKGFFVFQNPEWEYLTKRVKRIQYNTSEGLSQLEAVSYAVQAKTGVFANVGCIILDEGTSMADADLRLVRAMNVARNPVLDPDVAEGPDYIAEQNRFSKTFNVLMGAPVHHIIVCHPRVDKVNNLAITDIGFSPKLGAILKRDLHLVGHFTADLPSASGLEDPVYTRWVQVHPTRTIEAKTRITGLPVKIEASKLLTAITEFINGSRGEEEPKETLPIEPAEDVSDFAITVE
jgi:hypothetical protein